MSIAAYRLNHLNNSTCVVVGLGLVGRAVAASLSLFGTKICSAGAPAINWSDPDSVVNAVGQVVNSSSDRLELIWCAGRSGFSADDSELAAEYEVFDEIVELLVKAHKNLAISLVSSAGGLYEGSGGASNRDKPVSPLRPYGKWKLKQENLLQQRVAISRIYRVSSVYGVSSRKSRYGIVNALLESTYTNRPALIYAQASTLRDYVSNIDVGKHIVSQLRNDQNLVEIIASGRPTSIDMLANLIKRVSRRNLKVTYRAGVDNDKDIIFSKKSLAKEFKSCSLEEGILNLTSTYKTIKFGGA